MSRAPDTSQLGPLYLRWERMEKKRRDQQRDLKDLFAEAKIHGLNTKALRAAFLAAYADEYDDTEKREKREENETDVELYRMALARVREGRAFGTTPNASNSGRHSAKSAAAVTTPEHDPETGEIHEPQPLAAQTDQGSEPARFIAADGDAVETSAPVQPGAPAVALAAEAPLASAASGEGRLSDDPGLSANELSAPIQPETADEPGGRELSVSSPPATAIELEDSASSVRQAPVTEPPEGAPAGKSAAGGVGSAVPAAPSNVTPIRKKVWKHTDPAHADCLDPGQCGGFSNLGLCQSCKAALAGDRHSDEAARA